jgi:hypothetical protein
MLGSILRSASMDLLTEIKVDAIGLEPGANTPAYTELIVHV